MMPVRLEQRAVSMLRGVGLGLLLVVAFAATGCSRSHAFLAKVQGDWDAQRYESARDRLEKHAKDDPRNRHVYDLSRGVCELALQRPGAAVSALRSARNRMDELSRSDYRGWFETSLRSDEKRDYAGADFEQVLVRAMLAISDLMSGDGDADAFALQVLERQLEIIDSFRDGDGNLPKQAYKVVGFGSYLRAILHEDRPLGIDVAEREYRRLAEFEPEYPYAEEDIERVAAGRFAAPGNGVVHVITLVGRGPFRVETNEPVSEQALQIAQVMLALFQGRVVLPNLQQIRIPGLAFYEDNPTEVHMQVNGDTLGETVVVTDVEWTAEQQFDVMRDHIIGRAVMRRVFKIGLTEGAKAVVGRGTETGAVVGLGIDILGNIWSSRERADLRCWTLLPASFQAARVELPEGEHTITLRAGVGGRAVGKPQDVDVRVRAGRSTFVVALVPTVEGGPPPMTSDAAAPLLGPEVP